MYNFNTNWIRETWMEAFIEKEADPFNEVMIKDFCAQYKITYSHLHDWRKKNRQKIAMEVDKRRKEYITEIRSMAWKETAKRMKKSDKVLEMAFKLIGDMIERREERVEHLTPEDKREKVKRMLEEIASKAGDKPQAA